MAVTGPAGLVRQLGALRRFAAAGCRALVIPIDCNTRWRDALGIYGNVLAPTGDCGRVSTVSSDFGQCRAAGMGLAAAFATDCNCLPSERLA